MADARLAPWKKRAKYRNVKTEVDGLKFDSKKEAKRWVELKAMEKRGEISLLQRQVVFELVPQVVLDGRKRPPTKYIADFGYSRDGKRIVEDVKSPASKTPVYQLKRKLVKHLYNIEVVES